jgi:LacI family transcriptional regulator
MASSTQTAPIESPSFPGTVVNKAGRAWRGNPAAVEANPATPGLMIDVMVGIAAGTTDFATYPLIIEGIRRRAQIESRERPELGQIKIFVQYMAPAAFHPETTGVRLRRCPNGAKRGTLFVYPYAESAVEAVSQRIMTVSVLESYSRLGIDFVDTDDAPAMTKLVGLLNSSGHRRIGFVSWNYPITGHWVSRRYGGYAEALKGRGLTLKTDWVLNVLEDRPKLGPDEVVAEAVRLVLDDKVTAFVCAADHQAYHLIRGLEAAGIRVPHDCSVTGFDGVEPPAGAKRATSMRVPHEHVGSSALTRMVNRIIYPSSPQRKILVESQLVPGETTSTPPLP